MVLSDGFSETILTDINDSFPENEIPYADDYGYNPDSDLDEEEDPFAPLSIPPSDESTVRQKNPVRPGRVIIIRDVAYST
jgi:hypothetical protein